MCVETERPTHRHELGHNLGLSHASYDATTKGAVAWHDMEVDDWRDYASPFSVMGEADFEVAEAGEAYSVGQFSVEGKLNFDWLTNEDVALLEPYDANDVAQCSPCGPFLLQASDTGVFQAGELIGIEIGSKLAYRKLYAEYRSQWGGVLLTWADQGGEYWAAPDYGGTGVLANTVLVDTTPSTTSLKDAVLTPGESFLLDLGASADEAGLRFCTVDVGNVDANGRISVTVIASGTSAPTSTLSPTTASPTRRPTLASEQCSSTDKCCSKSEITVPSNDYFSAPRTFRKLEVGSAGSCCPSGGKKFCSFQNVDEGDFYYQYLFIYSASYFISSTLEECYADQNLYAQLDKAPLQAQCAAPTPEPTQRPTRNPVMAPGPTASYKPSAKPVSNPTPKPSVRPTLRPSFKPTALWSRAPTLAGATAAPSPECAGGLFRYKLELYPTAASFKAVYMLWYGEPVEGIVSVLRNMSLAAADVKDGVQGQTEEWRRVKVSKGKVAESGVPRLARRSTTTASSTATTASSGSRSANQNRSRKASRWRSSARRAPRCAGRRLWTCWKCNSSISAPRTESSWPRAHLRRRSNPR
ncbi:hypothetical protein M885DRAFT_17204 [Pelagophyceae sp. CCMP2097]|nr:hypothetical protein M885DRAFT_17204 [Pelagophyceae sp. CCMP2097]